MSKLQELLAEMEILEEGFSWVFEEKENEAVEG